MSSSGKEIMAADIRGPEQTDTAHGANPRKVVIVGSGASQAIDLSGAGFFNSLAYQDHFLTITVEGGASFWWFWSNNADTVDKTATGNGLTVGAFWPGNIPLTELSRGQYLIIQTSAAANVHVWLSSGKN